MLVCSEDGGMLDGVEEDMGSEAFRGLRYGITWSVMPVVQCSVAMLVQVCQGSATALLLLFPCADTP